MTEREKTSVIVAAFYALHKRTAALRFLQQKKHSPRHLAELFLHLSLLLGFPTMLDGFEKLAMTGLLSRQTVPSKRNDYRKSGLRTLRRVYGKQTGKLLRSLRGLHPDLPAMIIEGVYGKVISRPGLTLRERELVNLTVLTIQGLNRQLHSHVRGALRVGVRASTLKSVLNLLSKRFRVNTRAARELLVQLAQSY